MSEGDDFDEESIWGHCLRHKLALDDEDLKKLVVSLSESDASSLTRCGKPALESFIRILCGMLRKEAWLQAEACSIFAGMCQMDTKMFADVVNKDWFVISILRMLREPPDEQTLTIMLDVLKNVVAHESSRAENIAWLCTPSVIEICLAMVTSPFHDSCMALTQLMMTAATQLGPVALESFVKMATDHQNLNARYFGETALRIMNESVVDDETPLPPGYRPTLTVLGYIHSTKDSADFLYPADQKILVDVLLRHGAAIKTAGREFEETWLAWVRTIGGIVKNSTHYREDMHSADKILEMMRWLQTELPHGLDAWKAVDALLSDAALIRTLEAA